MSQRFLTQSEATEYKQVLESYHPSGQVVFDFAKSRFATIIGPAGAGKDTTRMRLLALYPDLYRSIISTTSRPLREGEVDGLQYHFKDLDFIQEGLDSRRFLQAELLHDQQISGLDFGDIAALEPEHYGIGILNVYSVKKLQKLNPDMKTVFIVPPTYDELLRRIHSNRSMKDDEIARRLVTAKEELTEAVKDDVYYLVTNDDLDRSVHLIHTFFQVGQCDDEEEYRTKEVIHKILNELSV